MNLPVSSCLYGFYRQVGSMLLDCTTRLCYLVKVLADVLGGFISVIEPIHQTMWLIRWSCFVLIWGHPLHSKSFLIPVAAVTRLAMITFVLGSNLIPVDQMNNAHSLNVTNGACMSTRRPWTNRAGSCLRYARDFLLYRDTTCSCAMLGWQKFAKFIVSWQKRTLKYLRFFCCSVNVISHAFKISNL